MLYSFHYVLIHRTTFQGDSYVGTGGVSQTFGVNVETATHDDVTLYEVLDALVDSCT